ncbi:MAG: DUF4388 domain-containing protein [Chloroflexi bacterium]|nr:DUF4388 domain-containing protein [Chloroflexota bacterium]
MSIRGSLRTMPAQDVFEWLDRRGASGELMLERGDNSRKFHVTETNITNAGSTNPAEYLGQLLINNGHIDEATLRTAFQKQAKNGMLIGKILVVAGLVTEQALREALGLKIREGVYDAMSWEDGTFVFEPDSVKTAKAIEFEVSIAIKECLEEGAIRARQWQAIRKLIPNDDLHFAIPDKTWVTRAKAGSPSALLLADVMQGMSVREIILQRHSLPFPVYQRLADLLTRGIIEIDHRPVPKRESEKKLSPSALIEAAKKLAKNGDKQAALQTARRALEAAPTDEDIKKSYAELERSLFAELSRSLLKQFRVPKLAKKKEEIETMNLSPEEKYLVGRIDGRWDLLSLMRVSPLREVEALITIQRLADRGILSLD